MNAPLPYAKHCEDRCKALHWQLQSFALAIAKLCVWDGQNCHRYHQSFLWFILIQKGREKKGWCNTLRQKGDFLGCFYSKSWSSPLFSSKKIGFSNLKQYLCTTRTRQASSQCSNVRVVLLWHNYTRRTRMGNSTSSPDLIEKKTPQQ